MRINLDAGTIAHRGLTIEQTLAFVRERGLDGGQFLEPSKIVDTNRLADLRALADSQGLAHKVGLPSANPVGRSRVAEWSVDPAEHACSLIKLIEAVALFSYPHARVYLGEGPDLGLEPQATPSGLKIHHSSTHAPREVIPSLFLSGAIELP